MGVKGLTSFIARKAEIYLQPFELHDCDLVIDGDNLSCNLFKGIPECNPAFGGDYDVYYRSVVNFFKILFKCNIRPFVLMDGGYEQKKMRTVEQRLRSRIASIKHVNPAHNHGGIFPLMMREVFIDAVRDSGVQIMRCLFEADDELAILSRKLNCPVLSYDSDFYIYNVKYIPLVTLTMKVLERKVGDSSKRQTKNTLSYTRARNLGKRMNGSGSLKCTDDMKNGVLNDTSKQNIIRYLDCCIYRIENLTASKIQKDILPLFAALLGNDYIQTCLFGKFFAQIGRRGGTGKNLSGQQKRIRAILKWLQHETKESALEKVLSRMKKKQRSFLLAQIQSASEGYNREESKAFDYFGLNEEDCAIHSDNDETDSDYEQVNKTIDEYISECDDDDDDEEEGEEEDENNVSEELDEQIDGHNKSDEDDKSQKSEQNETVPDFVNDNDEETNEASNLVFPSWFEERFATADLPRFFVDLFNLRLYINNPQIENFLLEDCNAIAIPILMHIYTLITHSTGDGTNVTDYSGLELRYLSRTDRSTKVHYKYLNPQLPSLYSFNPFTTDMAALKVVFSNSQKFIADELFTEIEKIPKTLQLCFLAIIYWSNKSRNIDIVHFYSVLICLVILNTIDEKYLEVRNEKIFNKKFGKLIQSYKKKTTSVDQETETESAPTKLELTLKKAEEFVKNKEPSDKIKFIPKISLILTYERLMKFFNVRDDYHKKHNDFSSTILHGFSELQSIIFFINSLNALVNKPFESIKISKLYNGTFLYNLYTSLKSRIDIEFYIKNHIFKESTIMFDYYQFLFDWCKQFVPFIMQDNVPKKIKTKRKKNTMGTMKDSKTDITSSIADMIDNENDTETGFNDVNNKFNALLQIK